MTLDSLTADGGLRLDLETGRRVVPWGMSRAQLHAAAETLTASVGERRITLRRGASGGWDVTTADGRVGHAPSYDAAVKLARERPKRVRRPDPQPKAETRPTPVKEEPMRVRKPRKPNLSAPLAPPRRDGGGRGWAAFLKPDTKARTKLWP